MTQYAYSFLDVQASIIGPNGSFSIGVGSGIAEGGITIDMVDDKGHMDIGADGTPMHSLHASTASRVTLRVQKTSPLNYVLDAMYRGDTTSAANYGQNSITVRNPVSGDTATMQACGFAKRPTVTYAKEAGENEWVFNCGRSSILFGNGAPALG